MRITLLALVATMATVCQASRYIYYLTGQHNVIPPISMLTDVTHVTLAFMSSSTFAGRPPSEWPLFTDVQTVRSKFPPSTAVLIAIGGWGDTRGFSSAAATKQGMRSFAANVKAMLDATGADGVDIDWEYPGGNGEDYKQIPNSQKTWEVGAYPKMLSEIRSAIGTSKIISAAVPGKPDDIQVAFTKDTLAETEKHLDYLNVMTYDLMNRRDNITTHHTGISNSLVAIDTYINNGIPAQKLNLGFALYIKWFKTTSNCPAKSPLGCPTVPMEDPLTGKDLGTSGAFSWHDPIPPELSESFSRAVPNAQYDDDGTYYFDEIEHIWWSWDAPASMAKKFPAIVQKRKLGGIFAWGLGEDAEGFVHVSTLNAAFRKFMKV